MAEQNPQNTKAEPMTYEVVSMPRSITAQRAAVAAQVDGMTVAQLKDAAANLQIDTAGATARDDLAEAVRAAARPTPAE